MTTNKANLQKAIETEIKSAQSVSNNASTGMKRCVVVSKESPRKYHVGFRFTKVENEVGFIEKSIHGGLMEEIVWAS